MILCSNGFRTRSDLLLLVFVKLSRSKIMCAVLLPTLLFALCQSAPARPDMWKWNPYFYPAVRVLSKPPTTTTTKATTTTTTTTTKAPRTRRQVVKFSTSRPPAAPILPKATMSNIDRRAAQSSTNSSSLGIFGNSTLGEIQIDLGNVTAINLALQGFIRSTEGVVRDLLISLQRGLLRLIGQADLDRVKFQNRIRNSTFHLTIAGQRAAAQTYEALPPFVNKLLQRLTTPTDGRSREQINAQLLEAVANLRQLKKMFIEAFDEHEKDFHEVFQERFTQINKYLRVPELPRFPFGWYS